jgi:predicted membrane-bound spermidine synthase
MALIIPTLLLSAGVGSFFSERLDQNNRSGFLIVLLLLCGLIIAGIFSAPSISEMLLATSKWMSSISVVALIFPLGFLMGMPFPLGMRLLSKHSQIIPIAWAVNGGMSVIGSILAIVLAMVWGFSQVALIAVFFYLCAMVCFPFLLQKT